MSRGARARQGFVRKTRRTSHRAAPSHFGASPAGATSDPARWWPAPDTVARAAPQGLPDPAQPQGRAMHADLEEFERQAIAGEIAKLREVLARGLGDIAAAPPDVD